MPNIGNQLNMYMQSQYEILCVFYNNITCHNIKVQSMYNNTPINCCVCIYS